MRHFNILLACALCAAIPLAQAATPPAAGKAAAQSKPVKASKQAGKPRVKKSVRLAGKKSSPRRTARMPALTVPATVTAAAAAPAAASAAPAAVPVAAVVAMVPAAVATANMPAPAPQQVVLVARNPYLAEQYAASAAAAYPPPYRPASYAGPSVASINPYLPQAPSVVPMVAGVEAVAPAAPAQGNPYLSVSAPVAESGRLVAMPVSAKLDPMQDLNSLFSSLKNSIPVLNGQDLLPTIKKVYPTGEKPLVILSFKCPTEMLGVTPPPMKALHEIVNFAFDGINKTNLLSFNMQQVCQ